MELVNKECNHCNFFDNELMWVPKDMVDVEFDCPICKQGKVKYSKYIHPYIKYIEKLGENK